MGRRLGVDLSCLSEDRQELVRVRVAVLLQGGFKGCRCCELNNERPHCVLVGVAYPWEHLIENFLQFDAVFELGGVFYFVDHEGEGWLVR